MKTVPSIIPTRDTSRAAKLAIEELTRLARLIDRNPTCVFRYEEDHHRALLQRIDKAGLAASELCDAIRPGGAE